MVNIIPKPARLKELDGKFTINPQTRILYTKGTTKGKAIAAGFADFLADPMDQMLEVAATDKVRAAKNSILLTTAGAPAKLGKEGYQLVVKPDSVMIRACKPAGLFYGLQSLRQLLPAGIETDKKYSRKITAQCVKIEDVPRFAWRGMHYDPCRNFYGIDHVMEYIDLLAMQKLNVLHLHLTEDQGWRIEIAKYPKLAEIAAWREGTDSHYWESKGDKEIHGGYFSKDDIRAIVQYAAENFITVLPEIELPGHAQAAIAAYPELSCTGGPHKVWTQWGISKDVYCAGQEKTFKFLENVLAEVIELFPSKYIHIGGDECPKDRWKECPRCQRRMKKEGLANEDELQSYFVKRIEKFVNSKGRKIIGWDEILEGGLAPNAAVMSWRGFEGGQQAASMGHPVVMIPYTHTYLDYKPCENTRSGRPVVLPIETVYSFDPEEGFKPAWKKKIMGCQGAMWSEYFKTTDDFYVHLFPRLCALSEVFWSPKNKKDFKEFKKRARAFTRRLDAMDIIHHDKVKKKK